MTQRNDFATAKPLARLLRGALRVNLLSRLCDRVTAPLAPFARGASVAYVGAMPGVVATYRSAARAKRPASFVCFHHAVGLHCTLAAV